MHTRESLKRDIERAGLQKGDVVFIRISYKAVGKVEGGPQTVIDAILDVIGKEGTLLATAFPLRIISYKRFFHRKEVYYKGMKPRTGIIPVLMAENPMSKFSGHPISPYVVIGKYADEITSFHTPESESYDIVKFILNRYSPKCLRVGGKLLDGTTHLAFSDGLRNTGNFQRRLGKGMYYMKDGKKTWMKRSVSSFCYNGFKDFFMKNIYNTDAVLFEGKIGEGEAMVTDMKKTYAIEHNLLLNNPKLLSCNSPECFMCQATYSYSETRKYIARMLKKLGGKELIVSLKRIYAVALIYLFGRKCV